MKKMLYILALVLTASLTSCRWEQREDDYATDTVHLSLSDLIHSYDLWYVDIDRTTGTGDVDFVSRAFTMSFKNNNTVYANNNIVGLGVTGNGFGIKTGVFDTYNRSGIISIHDDVFGSADFVVEQISSNEISLHNSAQNVTDFLVGYQKYDFDYDKLFYENITYFLQEYESWTKQSENIMSPAASFISENHLTFYVQNNQNVFDTSVSAINTPIMSIYWDYHGAYDVYNTSVEHIKELELVYSGNNGEERFELDILDDQNIRLTNQNNGNSYTFVGRDYIQYKTGSKRLKHSIPRILSKEHYILK